MVDQVGYTGPPRDPATVIRAALSEPDFVRQVIASYEEQVRGEPPIPWRQVREERTHTRHTA
ncbi:MAG: hypothetical protein AB7R89_09090 [Dehalococcoidia bacterium]